VTLFTSKIKTIPFILLFPSKAATNLQRSNSSFQRSKSQINTRRENKNRTKKRRICSTHKSAITTTWNNEIVEKRNSKLKTHLSITLNLKLFFYAN
jgi:hypothetical protein